MRVGWAFLCLTLILASGRADAQTPPATWLKLDASPFSILASSGWKFRQFAGVDSYGGEFVVAAWPSLLILADTQTATLGRQISSHSAFGMANSLNIRRKKRLQQSLVRRKDG